MPPSYTVCLTESARKMFLSIRDRRIRIKISAPIDRLRAEPEKTGKTLLGELSGYRSLRAAAQRHRLLYRMLRHKIEIHIVLIGIRKEGDRQDIYALEKKLIRTGLPDD